RPAATPRNVSQLGLANSRTDPRRTPPRGFAVTELVSYRDCWHRLRLRVDLARLPLKIAAPLQALLGFALPRPRKRVHHFGLGVRLNTPPITYPQSWWHQTPPHHNSLFSHPSPLPTQPCYE